MKTKRQYQAELGAPWIIHDVSEFKTLSVLDKPKRIYWDDPLRGGDFTLSQNPEADDGVIWFNGYCRDGYAVIPITPEMAGAKGDYYLEDGTKNTTPTDDTSSIETALSYCSSNKRYMTLKDNTTYSTSTINVDIIDSIQIKGNYSGFAPVSQGDDLLYSRANSIDKLSINGVHFIDFGRSFNFRYLTYIEDVVITKCNFTNNIHPIYMLCTSFGKVSIHDNIIDGAESDLSAGGITIGNDVDTLGVINVFDNEVKNIKYTGSTAGVEVHAIICMGEHINIINNIVENIRTSQPQTTSCEPIYAKFRVSCLIKDNKVKNSGAFGGAITIKGSGDKIFQGNVLDNSIYFDKSYTDATVGIQVYSTKVKVLNNVIENSGKEGILGSSTSEFIDSKSLYDNNTIIGCKASNNIRVYLNGDVVTNNKLIHPAYDGTGNGIAVSTTGDTGTPYGVNPIVKGNITILNDDFTGLRFYNLAFYDGYDKLNNVTCENNIMAVNRTSEIDLHFYRAVSINSAITVFNVDNPEGFERVGNVGYQLEPFSTHGSAKIWNNFPTVGKYVKGEEGQYKYPSDTGFSKWVCSVSGDAGIAAAFVNCGAVA